MKIIVANQEEFTRAINIAEKIANEDQNFECSICPSVKNTPAVCHVFWEYVSYEPEVMELQIIVKPKLMKKFNLKYKQEK